jgi:hypothetical protein
MSKMPWYLKWPVLILIILLIALVLVLILEHTPAV